VLSSHGSINKLSDIGISTTKEGLLAVDNAKLDKVLASDAGAVEALFNPRRDATHTEATDPGIAFALDAIRDKAVGANGAIDRAIEIARREKRNLADQLEKIEEREERLQASGSRSNMARSKQSSRRSRRRRPISNNRSSSGRTRVTTREASVTATASTVRATGLYRRLQNESRAAAADPVELVTMLYDELETAVGVLGAMMRQGQRVSATEPAHRARAILIGLDVGLDRDKPAAMSRPRCRASIAACAASSTMRCSRTRRRTRRNSRRHYDNQQPPGGSFAERRATDVNMQRPAPRMGVGRSSFP
jgi:hypothetical protein